MKEKKKGRRKSYPLAHRYQLWARESDWGPETVDEFLRHWSELKIAYPRIEIE